MPQINEADIVGITAVIATCGYPTAGPMWERICSYIKDIQKPAANSSYTAALEVCLRSLKLSKFIDISEGSILKVAACLNSVVKAQQNCA